MRNRSLRALSPGLLSQQVRRPLLRLKERRPTPSCRQDSHKQLYGVGVWLSAAFQVFEELHSREVYVDLFARIRTQVEARDTVRSLQSAKMSIDAVAQFFIRTEPVTLEKARELLGSSRAVHFKGFARGLDADPPAKLVSLLSSFDVVVFDGDSLDSKSFTKALPLAVAAAKVAGRTLRLLTFKYGAEESTLLGSWNGQLVHVKASDVFAAVSVSEAAAHHDAFTILAREPSEIVLSYLPVEKLSVATDVGHYQALGAHALQLTGARDVIAWGGGACVLDEWRLSAGLPIAGDGASPPEDEAVRAEARAAAGARRITWHLFPAIRYIPPTAVPSPAAAESGAGTGSSSGDASGAPTLVAEESALCNLRSAPPHFIVHREASGTASSSSSSCSGAACASSGASGGGSGSA